MASSTLYPPVVPAYMPAFDGDSCKIYFNLSKIAFSTDNIKSVHVSVVDLKTGRTVLKQEDEKDRYRASGILIITNIGYDYNKPSDWYVEINSDDIKNGWQEGKLYKVQIRFSNVASAPPSGALGETQSAWLKNNAGNFSEWSTSCIIKKIGESKFYFPALSENAIAGKEGNIFNNVSSSLVDFDGTYTNSDNSEFLYSYRVKIFDSNDDKLVLLDDSNTLYTNESVEPNKIHYTFKIPLLSESKYHIVLEYITINKKQDSVELDIKIKRASSPGERFSVVVLENVEKLNLDKVKVTDPDNPGEIISYKDLFYRRTSLAKEEEEGRIAFKIYEKTTEQETRVGNFCIRRCDSRDNFKKWTDIKIISYTLENDTTVNNDPRIFFDYTVESGVFYKYGIQEINRLGYRLPLNPNNSISIRDFEHTYLLGGGSRQLKLNLNNSINSYSYTLSEGKLDTIGGKYPVVSRNGNMKYRTFPLSGMISFNMDDNHTFTNDKEIYGNVLDIYNEERNKKYLHITNPNNYIKNVEDNYFGVYDYKKEYDFREKVLSFLQDGKPKLLKSATEGNILIKLMNVTLTPEQALGRMIGTFNATAVEIAEPTMDNYLKYELYDVGTYLRSYETEDSKLGQLYMEVDNGTDIIEEIKKQYDKSDINYNGYKYSLFSINNLSIEIFSPPKNIDNKQYGNILNYNKNKIIMQQYGDFCYYSFGEEINFNVSDKLYINKIAEEGKTNILVNFTYSFIKDIYSTKEIANEDEIPFVSQIEGTFEPNYNPFLELYIKYYKESEKSFSRLKHLEWTCIEAPPGSRFLLKDSVDIQGEEHVINHTGILNLEDLGVILDIQYLGRIDLKTGEPTPNQKCDCLINFIGTKSIGTYELVNNFEERVD